MNTYEKLLQEAEDNNVNVYDFDLGGNGLDGLYIDGNVAIDINVDTTAKKRCVLAEELGHHYTSVGDILDLSIVSNQKQERQARLYAYNALIGLDGLIMCYKKGCRTRHEMAIELDVTDDFLEDAINEYREKFGTCVSYNNYVIMFIPNLVIGKKDI